MKSLEFTDYVELYFRQYAPEQRGLSSHTISSYSDAILLFFRYYDLKHNIKPNKIDFQEINKERVLGYCHWLENEQKCSTATRNQRLTAIHSVMRYIMGETPMYSGLCRSILAIKMKKIQKKPPVYLSVDATKQLFKMFDTRNQAEFRDLVLLCLMYDSGIRVQELIQLRLFNLSLSEKTLLTVTGKGNKVRTLPLSSKTAELLRRYIEQDSEITSERFLFINRSGKPLTRAGIGYILTKYFNLLKETFDGHLPEKISPHTLRHSKATHLLYEGVNLIYIRDFLGHSTVVTTEIYASTNPEFLRKAFETADDLINPSTYYRPEKKMELIEFLKQIRK